MKIITDNATLKKYIPNHFTESEGESTFFEKLTPWLLASEDWMVGEIVGEEIDDIIAEDGTLYSHIAFAVVADALYKAVPSLDLVLTPNGFGVISTSNVAPASKERVERLRQTLLSSRDAQISLVLDALLRDQSWRESQQGIKFTSSMFMHPEDVEPNCGFDKFLKFRSDALLVEAELAVKAVSPELMAALRSVRRISATLPQDMLSARIMNLVRSIVEGKGNVDNAQAMSDIVQLIRTSPEYYPEWQGTATADLFTPPVFQNEKGASGYWF